MLLIKFNLLREFLENIGKIKNNSKVILDYAHSPAALELALLNIKEQFQKIK